MGSNVKIGAFFVGLMVVMLVIVGISGAIAQEERVTLNELFGIVDSVFHDETASMKADLLDAGYNLDTPYTLNELKGISAYMSLNYGGVWEDMDSMMVNVNSIDQLRQYVFTNYGNGGTSCTYHVKKLLCDISGPRTCFETCSTASTCYSCCDAGMDDKDEGWNEDDYNTCYKSCDKLRKRTGTNGNSIEQGLKGNKLVDGP
ncbi:hypothetical protein COU62_00850 [Candidatus Pacearchaeota archaeon CG10_big_fil_rev_8_21_14_0_10_35_219]|nr:hypothetical protein [Candidatus Pacearchaeota archaeon]OIO42766.1 MAG: hypothetical protein AUJ63_01985 [Candidatus Pacearchaeota archaeon CG1_02_35_32]PIO08234.1 MAG: hypothetical protein COU62_00850 [Candidatus Pacearchaeota archaeon CG10_big_fil_rev_8_21_14_0_10_35_219]PIY81743.1 MAG: hypothetical protein COY79_01145 [Candidatus Pacearchaeota archaeon CG_4_10_14_0_8_um_filter_35_169]PIZ80352.1 MAG: hypothetical protein COY00_01350 [Candidatus Pacearchaeota archaeon CG_4_10_14_0_2_um_filt